MCALLAGDVAMEGHLGLSRHTAPQARSNCGQTMCVGVCVCVSVRLVLEKSLIML